MANLIAQLRPASFRGISFFVPEDESAFGGRVVTFEYPGRDEPYHEPMGAAVQSFTVSCVIGGASFISVAAALEAALKKSGSGTLIHPHYGELEVIVKEARRSHSFGTVGDVAFSVTFEKYGKPLFPSAAADTVAGLGLASGGLFDALKGDFNARFLSSSIPDFLSVDAISRAGLFVEQVRGLITSGGLLRLITSDLPVFSSLTSLADDVISLFKSFSGSVKTVATPVIGSAPVSVVTASDVKAMMQALSTAALYSVADDETAVTANNSVRKNNAQALDNLFRCSALAAVADAAQYASYESVEEAIDVRLQVADAIEEVRDQLGRDQWDISWRAAGQTLAALSRDINDRIGRLPRTVKIKAAAVRPSLALANRLYGDDPAAIFDKAEDIVKRNRVRHPGFVPVKTLEVLIDAA